MASNKSWTKIWLGWLAFLVGADVIADRKDGATFSEHCAIWFHSMSGRAVLATFLAVLYAHLAYSISVIPVIISGVAVGYYILRGVKGAK